jgi:hypothetical protein
MTERHNKMYREIEGYEDALYFAYDIVDELDELKDKLRYGYSKAEVLDTVVDIHRILNHLEGSVQQGGYKIEE